MENNRKMSPPFYALILMLAVILILTLFYIVSSIFTSRGYEELLAAADDSANTPKCTVIIDAGHGGEDPGAVANGLREKNINLSLALKLRDFFGMSGYDVVLTRSDDVLLYSAEIVSSKKRDDLVNRVKIADEYENCVFVSIHVNKFQSPSSHGLQVFYSTNDEGGVALAESIQSITRECLMPDNKRLIKPGNETIYILEHLKCPAVLVECGFLSNKSDAEKLSDSDYQKKLAYSMFIGITSYLEENGT